METQETLRRRIDTTENLQSIVRTMKSLAAVSIRQYEQAAESLRDYTRTVELGLQAALPTSSVATEPGRKREGRTALVVFGSDHGLCGRFNDVIGDFAAEAWRRAGERERCVTLALGVQAASRLEAMRISVDAFLPLPSAIDGLTRTAREILIRLDAWRAEREVTRVLLLHNRRAEETSASPQRVQLMPTSPEILERVRSRQWPSRRLPQWTLPSDALTSALLQQYFFITVYRAGVESLASEHATRLQSMQAAERNIDDKLEEMNGHYRQRRQQAITEELLDVVSGAEALQQQKD